MESSAQTNSSGRPIFDRIWFLIGLAVIIRLVFIGVLNLLPEEAYYWNYAQHLDIGYLDHPPMVAWLIHISETILGKSELAVRLPAFLGWFLFAFFMYRFAENIAGKGIGKLVLLLLSVLPIYVSVGFLMTPDAPFYICWAGALYFLERAIPARRPAAWYGAGICLGLGLLSKYTMALIVPATVAYMLLDRDSRRWFRRPQPYLALLMSFIIFLPDLYWNMQHNWASFAFQGTRRWSGGIHFHEHILLGSVLILLTPLGVYEVIKSLRAFCRRDFVRADSGDRERRKALFMVVFSMVPLAVFVIHAVQGQPKLNWTGPVWLSILPLIGRNIAGLNTTLSRIQKMSISRTWALAAVILLLFYAGGFGYLAAGMPGHPESSWMNFPIAWQTFGDRVEELETRLEVDTGAEPIIIGLDKYWLASQASFYIVDEGEPEPSTAGQNLFGGNSLMWNQWVAPAAVTGRNGLLISFTPDRLDTPSVRRHFLKLGNIAQEDLTDSNGQIGHFYWRVGYKYVLE